MKKLLILLFVIASATSFYSCSKDKDQASNPSTTPFYVRMGDDPAPYDSVIIDVQSVEVKGENGTTVLLNAYPGLYNLLDFANGKDTLIAFDTIPTTTISQVRLILGSNNYVVLGGIRYDLKTPSAQQSGLKLNVHATLVGGVAYVLTLDFDASKSIVTTGNGEYILKPVIRVVSTALGGSISGVASPALALPATVVAIHSPDTITTSTNASGQFLIAGIPAGTYTVIIYPAAPFVNDTISNVGVVVGAVTNLGTMVLQ